MTTDEILVGQPLLTELDKVFPLSHKVQHFCNSSCQKEQNVCCCACFCCCTRICLDYRVNLFFFFLFLIFFSRVLCCLQLVEVLNFSCYVERARKYVELLKRRSTPPAHLYLWGLFEIPVSSATHPASWKHRVQNSLPCLVLSAETCELSSFTSHGQLIDGAGFILMVGCFVSVWAFIFMCQCKIALSCQEFCMCSPCCVPPSLWSI